MHSSPSCVYFKHGERFEHKSYCFISDDLEHDTYFVYELQRELIDLIKFKYHHIEKIEYFSNGCAGQYKNFKNMLNLCLHKTIFVLAYQVAYQVTTKFATSELQRMQNFLANFQ